MNYTLFDGQFHQKLKPLTFTKPVSFLRVGFYTVKEKWESLLYEDVGIRTKDYLGLKFNCITSETPVVFVQHCSKRRVSRCHFRNG